MSGPPTRQHPPVATAVGGQGQPHQHQAHQQHSHVANRYAYDDNDSDSEPGSQGSDLLDQILDNYRLHVKPEIRVKFKQGLANYSIGLCVAKPWNYAPRARITIKPVDAEGWLHRKVQKLLVVPSHHQVCLFSTKIPLWLFRLQFMAGYNWALKKPTLDYRITTKWGDGPRFKRKERYAGPCGLLLRCKWNMDLHLPDMEGHLGDLGEDEEGMDPIDVDFGRLDFEIPQVDIVLDSPLSLLGSSSSSSRAKARSADLPRTPLPAPTGMDAVAGSSSKPGPPQDADLPWSRKAQQQQQQQQQQMKEEVGQQGAAGQAGPLRPPSQLPQDQQRAAGPAPPQAPSGPAMWDAGYAWAGLLAQVQQAFGGLGHQPTPGWAPAAQGAGSPQAGPVDMAQPQQQEPDLVKCGCRFPGKF